GLVARAMKFAVVDPADWDRELVAHATSKRARLCKREVMRIRRHAAAHKAWLPQHESPVLLIAQANGFAQNTDCVAARLLLAPLGRFLSGACVGGYHARLGDSMRQPVRTHTARRPDRSRTIRWPVRLLTIADREEPRRKPLLDNFGICRCEGVLGRQT